MSIATLQVGRDQQLVALGQRQVNITRQTIGPKSGHRKSRKYKKKKGLHRLVINEYLLRISFIGCYKYYVINIIDHF